MSPKTPKTRGSGASVLTPNTHRGTDPATNHAAAHVRPIPIAPRIRRSDVRMIASDPDAAQLRGVCVPSIFNVLCGVKYPSGSRDSRARIAGSESNYPVFRGPTNL